MLPTDTCHLCLGINWFKEHWVPDERECYKYVVDKKGNFSFHLLLLIVTEDSWALIPSHEYEI